MYRYIAILTVALWSAGAASATTWADGLFDSLSRDFGTVPRGPVVSHPFRLVNNTGTTVRIAGVRVSCGCVTARPLQSTLAPGQETAVIAELDTRRFQDSRTVTIFVTFAEPGHAEVRLWLRANSRDDVSVYPDTLGFGRVKRGEGSTATTRIALMGNGQFRILGVTCESNYVQPVARIVAQDAHQVDYELTARLRPDTPPGHWYTDVWVTTNNPATPRLRIPVTVEVQSALSVSPNLVLLGSVKAGSEAVRKIIVRGVKPFTITSVRGVGRDLKVLVDTADQKKTVHVLTVTLRPYQAGVVDRVLFIDTDLAEEGSIDFTARAHVMP